MKARADLRRKLVRLPRRSVTAPVATLGWSIGLVVLVVGLAVLASVGAVGLAFPGSWLAVAVAGGTIVLTGAGLAAAMGRGLGSTIDRLVEQSTRPGADRARSEAPPAVPVRELDDLFTALAALQQRVRVSDDLAERHRRNADAASAGMFELLSGLVAAEEGARGQLSAELHDTVAQSLGIARRLLAELRDTDGSSGLPGGSAERTDPIRALVTAAEQVEEAEESLRATMARTRPPALRDGDLAAAVTLLRDDLEHRYGLDVGLTWPEAEYPIPLATAVAVYRFFQEALLNVVKHAEVDAAEAALEVDARFVLATVRDRGIGLAAVPAVAGRGGRHVGLGLLRERARLAGGRLDVVSEVGVGTTLSLRLPRPALPDRAVPSARVAVPEPRQAGTDPKVSADAR
jgi:signal transduction histidine kinase